MQIIRPYIALNSETYIFIKATRTQKIQEISYEFYCEECFVVKHRSKYSYKSVIYFNLNPDIIKENCNFIFYFNKSDIKHTVPNGWNEIIPANWTDNKHIVCIMNNNIPIIIPSYPYVLVNRSVLCSCRIETENNFLLESLTACHNAECKLVMYFTVNIAFVNYLDNLTESLTFPILLNRTTHEQTLPICYNLLKSILTY